ncbi:MAG TPA: transcriptional regulator [Thermoanaerobaculia bacterium]|nr:transcriptional regulator [Thermoanaerobaculia bacterium]
MAEELQTRRQQIVELLARGPWGFEELRRELAVTVRLLEQDLHHVERSLRADGRRLLVEAAGCDACGFTFEGREARHFYAPSRCPRCRSERIRDPRFSIPGAGS